MQQRLKVSCKLKCLPEVKHCMVSPDHHPDRVDAERHTVFPRHDKRYLAVLVSQLGRNVGPLTGRLKANKMTEIILLHTYY